jgi:hypothetical protein
MGRKIEIILAIIITIIYLTIGIFEIALSTDLPDFSDGFMKYRSIVGWIVMLALFLALILFYDRIHVSNRDGSETPGIIFRFLG